jgi:Winged helix DNA-binding domain
MQVAQLRLAAQQLVPNAANATPVAIVRHMLAMQGQDLPGVKWAIGVRAPGLTVADVDAAFAARELVRSWPLRGTLHVVAAEDLKWLLALAADKTVATAHKRRLQLGLDDKVLRKIRDVAERALAGGKRLSRDALIDAWNRAKLDAEPHRAYHAIWHLAHHAVICQGPDEEFVLVDEWIAKHRSYDRDEALGELVRRYFIGHGPATLADLARWIKLPQRDLKLGLEVARNQLVEVDDMYMAPELAAAKPLPCLLLPGFDELLLGYEDRTATIDKARESNIVPGGNGIFKATVVAGGRVVGTWKRKDRAKEIVVEPLLWGAAPKGLAQAAAAYGKFLGKPATVSTKTT